ncbi:MAG TPA: oligopeptide/dipeptide ABC transporter ATP-binding protein [Magnetospirillaceae bacterium]
MTASLLTLDNVVRHYRLPRENFTQAPGVVRAVEGVSLTINAGRSLGVVGESGSGKSTLARLAMALEPPTSGRVLIDGKDINVMSREELRRARRDFQMVFQDPYGSLDPRQTVARVVAEPLAVLGETSAAEQRKQVAEMLDSVGLRAADMDKYPHEFSGGQRQRIAIARALLTRPKLIVADEPVSALDVSVQAQVLNLLNDLQVRFGVTYLFISHDLAVVDHVCDEVAVMYRGRVVEQGPAQALFQEAAHPYTRALLEAVPKPVPRQRERRAVPPPQVQLGTNTGCAFADRCHHAQPRCRAETPALRPVRENHLAACHFAEQVMAEAPPTEINA